jgi:hypothetical protein
MSILLSLLIPFGTQGPSHALFLEQDEPGAVFWNYHGCGSKVNAQEHGLSLVPSILKAAHFVLSVYPKCPKQPRKNRGVFFSEVGNLKSTSSAMLPQNSFGCCESGMNEMDAMGTTGTLNCSGVAASLFFERLYKSPSVVFNMVL